MELGPRLKGYRHPNGTPLTLGSYWLSCVAWEPCGDAGIGNDCEGPPGLFCPEGWPWPLRPGCRAALCSDILNPVCENTLMKLVVADAAAAAVNIARLSSLRTLSQEARAMTESW